MSDTQMEAKHGTPKGVSTRADKAAAAAANLHPDGSNRKTPPGPPKTPMPRSAVLRSKLAELQSRRRTPSPVNMPTLENDSDSPGTSDTETILYAGT